MYYTYIIWSEEHSIAYKGMTHDPEKRLWEHNNNVGRFTANKGPWALVYLKKHFTKRDALIEEKRIKRLNDRSIHKMINSPDNIAPPLG
jgi:putative endonuclease